MVKDGPRWRVEFFPDSAGVKPKLAICDGNETVYVGFGNAIRSPTSPITAIETLYRCAKAGRYHGVTVDGGFRCHRFSGKDPLDTTFTILFYADSLLPRRYVIETAVQKVESVYVPLAVDSSTFATAYDINNKSLLFESHVKDEDKGQPLKNR